MLKIITIVLLILLKLNNGSLLAQPINLLCIENGTRISKFSSSDWNNHQTYFESEDDSEAGHYCSKEGISFPHYLIYEFALTSEISVFEFNTDVEELAFPGVSAKDLNIYATNAKDTNFIFIQSLVLDQDKSEQLFQVKPFQARRLKIEIISNYGEKLFTQLGQIKAFGIFIGTPIETRLTGTWMTTFGEMKIAQTDPYVYGCLDFGMLHGTYSNSVFSFYWTEDKQKGIVSAILNEEGSHLLGFWRSAEGTPETWSAELISYREVSCAEEPLHTQLSTTGETLIFNVDKKNKKTTTSGLKTTILSGAVQFLEENPDKKLSIEGFSDSDSLTSKQKALAELWALGVKNYLVNQGIAHNRLLIKGISEAPPLAAKETVTGKTLNSRIRLKVH